MHKRVVVTGATGTIGKLLCQTLLERGYEVTVFSRDPQAARTKVPGASDYVPWQPNATEPWAGSLDGAFGVINLAGEPLFDGYLTEERLRAGGEGRVIGTRGLVDAIGRTERKPSVLVNASSTGIYGFTETGDEEVTEATPPPRQDLWSIDSERWEAEAYRAEGFGVRVPALRIGVALERSGLLEYQAQQFRVGRGGYSVPGSQWFPWIHIDDVVGLLMFLLEDIRVHGPINGTAPGVVRNQEYADTLASVLGMSANNVTSEEALRQYMGLAAEVTIHLRRVVPKRALELGYPFKFPELEPALRDLLDITGVQA